MLKLFRWLKSRPLARVRRNLATRRRVAAAEAVPTRAELSADFKAYYRRYMAHLRQNRATLYAGPIWPEVPGEQLSKERWRKRDAEMGRLIEEYPREQRDE